MRPYILRTLLVKEALRHLANRGTLALVLLALAAALLLARLSGLGAGGALAPGVRVCYVEHGADNPLVDYLRRHVPPELAGRLRFRPLAEAPTDAAGRLVYAAEAGAIQLRPAGPGHDGLFVWFWHPGADPDVLAPFEAWFWRAWAAFLHERAGTTAALPSLAWERASLHGGADPGAAAAAALALLGLFLPCVYLLPAVACEERERGIGLALALSPATPAEMVAARLLFYPPAGLALAALLVVAVQPAALARPVVWLILAVAAVGATGVGLTLASVAPTQRAASLAALAYTLAVALFLAACRQLAVPFLPDLALEAHAARLLHTAFAGPSPAPVLLVPLALLAAAWVILATLLFRRLGWQ